MVRGLFRPSPINVPNVITFLQTVLLDAIGKQNNTMPTKTIQVRHRVWPLIMINYSGGNGEDIIAVATREKASVSERSWQCSTFHSLVQFILHIPTQRAHRTSKNDSSTKTHSAAVQWKNLRPCLRLAQGSVSFYE